MNSWTAAGTFQPEEVDLLQQVFDEACRRYVVTSGTEVGESLAAAIFMSYQAGIRDREARCCPLRRPQEARSGWSNCASGIASLTEGALVPSEQRRELPRRPIRSRTSSCGLRLLGLWEIWQGDSMERWKAGRQRLQ